VSVWDEKEVLSFVTSGEPPEQSTVDAYLTFELAIEEQTLANIEAIFVYIGTEILGWFERG